MIDMSKPLRTKVNKEPVTIIATNGRGEFNYIGYIHKSYILRQWNSSGEEMVGSSNRPGHRLENVPVKKTGYVNIYPDGESGQIQHTRVMADSRAHGLQRIACIKVTYEEGQFDE